MIARTRNLILYFWLDFWSWYVAYFGRESYRDFDQETATFYDGVLDNKGTIISTNWQAIYCIADTAIRTVNVKEVKRANVMEFEAEIQSWRIHIWKEDPNQR